MGMEEFCQRQKKYFDILHQIKKIGKVDYVEQDMFYSGFGKSGASGVWILSSAWKWEKPAIFRNILWNELVFDIDKKKWDDVYELDRKLVSTLKDLSFPYYEFITGGKGAHISLFIDVDDHILDKWDWRDIRVALINYIAKEMELKADEFDLSRVRWNERARGVLVRACGGHRRLEDESSSFKSYVYDLPKNKIVISKPWEVIYPQKIKVINVTSYIEKKLELSREEAQKSRKKSKKGSNNSYDGSAPPCIQKLIKEAKEGVNLPHDARFFLMCWLLNVPYNDPKDPHRIDKVASFFAGCPDYDETTRKQIEHAIEQGYHKPNWITIKNHGHCPDPDKYNCPWCG